MEAEESESGHNKRKKDKKSRSIITKWNMNNMYKLLFKWRVAGIVAGSWTLIKSVISYLQMFSPEQ